MKIPIEQAWNEFRPEQVVLVLSNGKDGLMNIMPAGWCMHCSFKPQLIAISIGKSRYTHKLLSNSDNFVIAVPNKDQEELVKFAGSCSGREVDKFKEKKIETIPGKGDTPLLKKATLNFECMKYASYDSGDHTIFLGEVKDTYKTKNKGVLMNFGRKKGKRIFKEISKDFHN